MPRKAVDPIKRAQETLADPQLGLLARQTIDHATDSRFNDLDRKEAHYRGTMYERRPYDWQGRPVPLNQSLHVGEQAALAYSGDRPPVSMRQPNSRYAVGRIVPNRFASMLFGNRVFPYVQVDKSKTTEQYLNGIIKQAQLKLRMLYAAQLGGAMGSVVPMFKVVDGKFKLEILNAKWIIPLWKDFDENEMRAFSICYPVMRQVYDKDAEVWRTKPFLFRRLVTEDMDIEFELQDAKIAIQGSGISVKPADPKAPLKINKERTYHHGLGFVPAQYIQHVPRFDQIDGDAACETAYDIIDRINENLAAIHHAMQGNLDPTLVLKITPEDYKKLLAMGGMVRTGADGEGIIVGDKGDAKFIEITCQGIITALDIVDKLIGFALEISDCVIPDPYKVSGAAQSAAAIQLLFSKMIDKADTLRTQYGENGLKKILAKMIRAYHLLSSPVEKDGEVERGTFKAVKVKDPKTGALIEVAPEEDIDYDDLDLIWGQFFAPTSADIFQLTEAAVMASGGKAVTTVPVAARAVAPYFQDLAVEQTIVDLERQEKEALAREEAANKAQNATVSTPKPKREGNKSDNRTPTPDRKA